MATTSRDRGGRTSRSIVSKHANSDLPLQVLKKFRVIYGSVRHHFREVERTCGVSGSQLWILREIARTPGVGVSELAERLSIHQSTSSQLVEKLSSRGYVLKQRLKQDQRRVGLVLSNQAAKLISKAPGPAEGLLPEALRAMSEEHLAGLDARLSEVIEQLHVRDDRFADKPLADL